MRYIYIPLLILSLTAIRASIYTNLKKNVLSILGSSTDKDEPEVASPSHGSMRYFQQKKQADAKDKKSAKNKASVLKNVRTHEETLNIGNDIPSSKLTESLDKKIGREYYHMDPVLNELRRRSKYRRKGSSSSSGGTSSELEMKFWMDEWDEHWMQKKFEALNSTQPRGDVVNMVAARPWGVPCGDPNQHDMPWGTCMLPAECDAEYRIYRGDYFCGRTMYICCSLLLTNYDMYQGLDISFEGSSFSTDSNEKNDKGGSQEDARKKRRAERNKRKKERDKRKRRIRKSIRKIITEIRKILNRAFRNGTSQRKRKTKELKKFIEMMKKQYRKDRKSVVNVHEYEMVKIDEALQQKLDQIQGVNEAFMTNDTYREIIVNGTVNKAKLMRLLRTHPELAKLFMSRRSGIGVQLEPIEEETENPKVLEYDLEKYKIQLTEEDCGEGNNPLELNFFTYGSKTSTGTGNGVFSEDLNVHIAHNTVFQAECMGIILAATAVMALEVPLASRAS